MVYRLALDCISTTPSQSTILHVKKCRKWYEKSNCLVSCSNTPDAPMAEKQNSGLLQYLGITAENSNALNTSYFELANLTDEDASRHAVRTMWLQQCSTVEPTQIKYSNVEPTRSRHCWLLQMRLQKIRRRYQFHQVQGPWVVCRRYLSTNILFHKRFVSQQFNCVTESATTFGPAESSPTTSLAPWQPVIVPHVNIIWQHRATLWRPRGNLITQTGVTKVPSTWVTAGACIILVTGEGVWRSYCIGIQCIYDF